MATTDVPVDNGEDAFRPDDLPPYTGPDLALRWQWSDAGARLAVVPVQADNGMGAPRSDVPPYTGPYPALRWPYTQRPEEEYYDEYDHEGPDYDGYDEEGPDSEDERYAREPFDICERDHEKARWDEDYDY